MRSPEDCHTTQEVDSLIAEICRNLPPGHASRVEIRWAKGEILDWERQCDPKLEALCNALARRAALSASTKAFTGEDGHYPA